MTQPPRDIPVASVGGGAGAAVVALACLVMPTRLLEALVARGGIGSLVNAAAPPLGITARLLLAAGGGVLMGAVAWAVLVLAAGERRVAWRWPAWRLPDLLRFRARAALAGPIVRRADAHRDALPRPPILAERELGMPFLSIVAPREGAPLMPPPLADERPLPDLDTALAAIDPAAIPAVPREPVRPVAPLAIPAVASPTCPAASPIRHPVPLASGERIDSVELGADARDRGDSIEALLARLERGTRRRPVVDKASPEAPPSLEVSPEPTPTVSATTGSLEETLIALRRLASRG